MEIKDEVESEEWGSEEVNSFIWFKNNFKSSTEKCKAVYDQMIEKLESKEFKDWIEKLVID